MRVLVLIASAQALQLLPVDIRASLREGSTFVPCHDFSPGWRETRERLYARGALAGVAASACANQRSAAA